MRIRVKLLLFILVGSLIFITPVSAAVKSGGSCKKVGTTTTSGGKKYTCVKSGTRLVWNKGVAVKPVKPSTSTVPSPVPEPTLKASPTPTTVPTPTPTPEPIVLPTSFDDLFVNRKGISLAAWQKSSEIIKANKSKAGTLEIFTGPNTKPNFDDYPTPVGLVSRLFPSKGEPTRTIVIRYRYVDIEWAQTTLRSKLTAEDFTRLNNNEGGKVILGRCDESAKNCMGAMQQSTFSGLSLIIQGVPNPQSAVDTRFATGMLEAHEYFHSLQRIPIMGKTDVWPHAWFREGSAEWVQNMAVNYLDYRAYEYFLKADCIGNCQRLSEADIVEFLEKSYDNYTPAKFDQFLNYSLSSRFIEALVAIKGPDPLVDMYAEMGKKLTFDQAFKNIYGVEWSYALPILAKTVYTNLKEGN